MCTDELSQLQLTPGPNLYMLCGNLSGRTGSFPRQGKAGRRIHERTPGFETTDQIVGSTTWVSSIATKGGTGPISKEKKVSFFALNGLLDEYVYLSFIGKT